MTSFFVCERTIPLLEKEKPLPRRGWAWWSLKAKSQPAPSCKGVGM